MPNYNEVLTKDSILTHQLIPAPSSEKARYEHEQYLNYLGALQRSAWNFKTGYYVDNKPVPNADAYERIEKQAKEQWELFIQQRTASILKQFEILPTDSPLKQYEKMDDAKFELAAFKNIALNSANPLHQDENKKTVKFIEDTIDKEIKKLQSEQERIFAKKENFIEFGLVEIENKLNTESTTPLRDRNITQALGLLSVMKEMRPDQQLLKRIDTAKNNLTKEQELRKQYSPVIEAVKNELSTFQIDNASNMSNSDLAKKLIPIKEQKEKVNALLEKIQSSKIDGKEDKIKELQALLSEIDEKVKSVVEQGITRCAVAPKEGDFPSVEQYKALEEKEGLLKDLQRSVEKHYEESLDNVFQPKMDEIEIKKKEIVNKEILSLKEKSPQITRKILSKNDISQAKELAKLIPEEEPDKRALEKEIEKAESNNTEYLNNKCLKIARELQSVYDGIEKETKSFKRKNASKKDIEFLGKIISSISDNKVLSLEQKAQLLYGAISILQEKMQSSHTTVGMKNFQKLLANTQQKLDTALGEELARELKTDPDKNKTFFKGYLRILQTHNSELNSYSLTSKMLEGSSRSLRSYLPSFNLRRATAKQARVAKPPQQDQKSRGDYPSY